jgi:hypothetical protein
MVGIVSTPPEIPSLETTPRKPVPTPSLSRLQRLLRRKAHRETPLPPPQPSKPWPCRNSRRLRLVQFQHLRLKNFRNRPHRPLNTVGAPQSTKSPERSGRPGRLSSGRGRASRVPHIPPLRPGGGAIRVSVSAPYLAARALPSAPSFFCTRAFCSGSVEIFSSALHAALAPAESWLARAMSP